MPLGFAEASGTPITYLETSFIREGIKPVIPYDDMIQDSHIEQQSAIFDLPGNLSIGITRYCVATRVVVTKDDAGGMSQKSRLKDDLGIHNCTGCASLGDPLEPEALVCPVQ